MTLKVTIKDGEALKAVTVQQIKTYLSSKGWYKKEDFVRTFTNSEKKVMSEIWSKDLGQTVATSLFVPLSEDVSDYTARISELFIHLERYECRSQLELFVDITQKSLVIRPKKIAKTKEN